MRKTIDGFYRALQVLVTVLMMALVVPVVLQILSRFTELIPRYIWTEEVARFCFIWIIMIGSMIAVRDGSHFDLDVLPKPRTARGQAISRIFVHTAMLLMALTFLVFGYRFALFGLDQESELTGLNMLFIHAAWPLAGLAFAVFLGEKIWDDVALYRQGRHGRA
ncbi:MAG TPA: TRAP transporter small permease [Burkholderiales bacterium]|nr:TRAP transporter small permease [Burkholderiales bacterium]